MTAQRSFKARVRERMQKTGERYSTARANLLRSKLENHIPVDNDRGIVSGYERFGGIQSDTAIVCNLFEQSRIENPDRQ